MCCGNPWNVRVASHEAWKATALRSRVWDATRTFHGSPQHIKEDFALYIEGCVCGTIYSWPPTVHSPCVPSGYIFFYLWRGQQKSSICTSIVYSIPGRSAGKEEEKKNLVHVHPSLRPGSVLFLPYSFNPGVPGFQLRCVVDLLVTCLKFGITGLHPCGAIAGRGSRSSRGEAQARS